MPRVAVARAAGARIVAAPRGRGTQLAAGRRGGAGRLALVPACRLPPRAGLGRGRRSLHQRPPVRPSRAGYFAFALDDASPAARRLERIVAWRCRVFGLPYGDQGLLIARTLYDAVGGFAALPLMEDVDLARRLGRRRLAPLGMPAYASGRRYRQSGYMRRPLRNLLCLSLYFIGVPTRRIARLYG